MCLRQGAFGGRHIGRQESQVRRLRKRGANSSAATRGHSSITYTGKITRAKTGHQPASEDGTPSYGTAIEVDLER
jgi:hypothetical protein